MILMKHIRRFQIWWITSSVDQRRELVKRWYDLVIFEDGSKTSGEVAKMSFYELPVTLVIDLCQDDSLQRWICGHCGKEKPTELGLCPHCFKFPVGNALTRREA